LGWGFEIRPSADEVLWIAVGYALVIHLPAEGQSSMTPTWSRYRCQAHPVAWVKEYHFGKPAEDPRDSGSNYER
jgi:hypothetical protein